MSEIARHRRGGQAGRRAERAAAPIVQKKYITREIPLYELLNAEGLELIHEESMTILEEIGIDFRYEPALKLWREAGADVRGPAGALPTRLDAGDHQDGAAAIHPARPQSGAQRRHRRPQHRVRADLRLALRARLREQAPLRHARGSAELHQARLHDAGAAPFRRRDLRAGRRARAEAASRHRLFPHQIFRQAVHGHRHRAGARRRHGAPGADPVRRQTSSAKRRC